MWFGLLPGPFTVIRAFTPRPRRRTRRSCAPRRRPSSDDSDLRSNIRLYLIGAAMFGLLLVSLSGNGVQPGHTPPGINAPYGWYTDTDGYLEPITGVNVPPVIYPKAKNSGAPFGWVLLLTGGAGLLLTVLWRPSTGSDGPTIPPDFPPGEQLPSPLPDYPPPSPRSGHIPIPMHRELPADRPHPWRTWEG